MACLFAALSAGCGDNQPSPGNAACPHYQGQDTVAAIALSPFADKEAETLAIEASGKFVAPKQVYEHIVSDLALIRSQNPAVQDIRATESWAPDELLMSFDAEGMSTVQAGTYTDWNCANTYYGFLKKEVISSFIVLHFDHLFNAPLLASEYSMFPHVDHAEPNGIFGDGNDVCVSIENDTKYNYIFDAGSGDCPAGCISHQYWGFSTDGAPVRLTALGTYVRGQGNPPAWFTALAECTNWL
jgi:hypothetical protein